MNKAHVLLLNNPERAGIWGIEVIEELSKHHELRYFNYDKPVKPQFEGIDVVVQLNRSTPEMMDAASEAGVKFWQLQSVGFEHFDLEYMKSKGIPVSNCPGIFSSVALAQTAMMFILMLAHKYNEAQDHIKESVNGMIKGHDLVGRTLALVGFGASAQELARRAKPFGMIIKAIDVRPIEQEVLDEIQPDFLGSPNDLDQLCADCDYLSLHLHLNKQTEKIISAERIALMKPTACLINIARGGLVDQDALFEALLGNKIGGAGLDVFAKEPVDPTEPVLALPNVFALPHTAGGTDGTARNRAVCAATNCDRVAEGLDPLYRIDM